MRPAAKVCQKLGLAVEIRVLLAKSAAGDVPRLSEEDGALLEQQLGIFQDGMSVSEDKSTDSYYLPQIKSADRQTFCKGVAYAQHTLHTLNTQLSGWQQLCNGASERGSK